MKYVNSFFGFFFLVGFFLLPSVSLAQGVPSNCYLVSGAGSSVVNQLYTYSATQTSYSYNNSGDSTDKVFLSADSNYILHGSTVQGFSVISRQVNSGGFPTPNQFFYEQTSSPYTLVSNTPGYFSIGIGSNPPPDVSVASCGGGGGGGDSSSGMFSIASSSESIGGALLTTGQLIAVSVAALLIGLVSLFGVGYAIRKIRRLSGKSF